MKNIEGAAAAAIKNQGVADVGPESANESPAAGLAHPVGGAQFEEAIADQLNNFFSRWESEPVGEDCVSDALLVELSEQKDTTRWPEHVSSCSRCRNVITLLQRADEIKTRLLSRDK